MARSHGFETWLNIPVQTHQYPNYDTGNKTILLRSSLQLNLERLLWSLSQGVGYAGVYARFDGTFAPSKNMIKDLFEYVFIRGLGYLEMDKTGNASLETQAVSENAPYLKNDLTIHSIKDLAKIDAFIADINKQKTNIITLDISPKMLDKIPSIIQKIRKKNIKILPLSAVYAHHWSAH